MDQATILRLISRIYDAAAAPASWPEFVADLTAVAGCAVGGFHVQELRGGGKALMNVGADPRYVQSYEEYYASKNPWSRRHGPLIRKGEVVLGLAQRDLVGSEYYEDFWRPQGFFDSLSVYVEKEAAQLLGLIVIRSKGDSAFHDDEVTLFRILSPHLQRAVDLQKRLYHNEVRGEALVNAMDRLPHGVIVVNEQRKVIFASSAAVAVLDQRDGLVFSRGEIIATDPQESGRFRRLVQTATETGLGRSLEAGGVMELSGTGARVSVLVAPLNTAVPFLLPSRERPAAVILIGARGSRAMNEDQLAVLYDLTPTEARVANLLAGGRSVDQTTKELRISRNTARTHLKRILQKTGTTRQGDLISLLLSSAVAARRLYRDKGAPTTPKQVRHPFG
jgi:DNA-binding CsgD family transcriptional regulator/PAS domain-containing protein